MTCYRITYKLRSEMEGLAPAEKATYLPYSRRVSASNLTRATSSVVNQLQDEGVINGKADVVILEGRVEV